MLPGSRLHEIVAARAREAPERVAVTAGTQQISYRELDARATQVACHLRGERGVGTDTLVGLCCDRGIPLIVGMLGILKAGGAYVPLDPGYPEERIRALLDGTDLDVVVTTGPAADRLAGMAATAEIHLVRLDELADENGSCTDGACPGNGPPGATDVADHRPAYVIHTSGSTGTPKGVLVEHRQVVRLFTSTALWFGFDHRDVWALCHAPSFDFSVWEIWGALLHGGRLVIVPAETTRRPAELLELLERERVTVLNQTPSAFRQLTGALGEAPELALRLVIFGGERLDVPMLRPWLERYGEEQPRLVNMYGITETTVHVTYRRIRRSDLAQPEHSPIGVAIPDLRVTLHDPAGEPVPTGTPGEIRVSGAGVTRGYLNRPELTAERFVTGPDGTRSYRSGDLAVRAPNGDLRYLGRLDDQLQVRGYRIEPYEVEACLLRHPSVRAAAVTAREYPDGDTRLVACVQPADGRAGLVDQLTGHVAGQLPAYLRPSHYELVDRLPVTDQGKVDRAALRAGHTAVGGERGAGVEHPPEGPPESAAAAAIGRIVAGVLERDRVGPDEDLFDLGATSLMFIRIVAEVNEQCRVALTGSELDDTASVNSLAAAVAAAAPAEPVDPVPALAQ